MANLPPYRKRRTPLPTQDTLDKYKKRIEKAEHALADEKVAHEICRTWGEGACKDRNRAEKRAESLFDELGQIDSEARLISDLESAVVDYNRRSMSGNPNQFSTPQGFQVATIGSREPYYPALESPLGRAILHLVARHCLKIEATIVYPDNPDTTPMMVPTNLIPSVDQLIERHRK